MLLLLVRKEGCINFFSDVLQFTSIPKVCWQQLCTGVEWAYTCTFWRVYHRWSILLVVVIVPLRILLLMLDDYDYALYAVLPLCTKSSVRSAVISFDAFSKRTFIACRMFRGQKDTISGISYNTCARYDREKSYCDKFGLNETSCRISWQYTLLY